MTFTFREEGPTASTETVEWPDAMTTEKVLSKYFAGPTCLGARVASALFATPSLMNDREIHGVVAREFSRLMRPENFSDYALLQAFADSNTILYLPEGPIDFSSKTGRLLGTIRAAIAGMERTEILERIWSAKEEKRRAGGFAQSRICLPLGVTFDGKWSYTPDAESARGIQTFVIR